MSNSYVRISGIEYCIQFAIGEIVYLKTDTTNTPRIVCEITICGHGGITYHLMSGTEGSNHYEAEIQKNEPIKQISFKNEEV